MLGETGNDVPLIEAIAQAGAGNCWGGRGAVWAGQFVVSVSGAACPSAVMFRFQSPERVCRQTGGLLARQQRQWMCFAVFCATSGVENHMCTSTSMCSVLCVCGCVFEALPAVLHSKAAL